MKKFLKILSLLIILLLFASCNRKICPTYNQRTSSGIYSNHKPMIK